LFIENWHYQLLGTIPEAIAMVALGTALIKQKYSWKKILLGNGWAKKEEAREYVKALGYEVKNQHEVDAICLALTFLREV